MRLKTLDIRPKTENGEQRIPLRLKDKVKPEHKTIKILKRPQLSNILYSQLLTVITCKNDFC